MNIAVEGETNLIGSVIGGGNTTLRTGELNIQIFMIKIKDITLVLVEVLHLVRTIKWMELQILQVVMLEM